MTRTSSVAAAAVAVVTAACVVNPASLATHVAARPVVLPPVAWNASASRPRAAVAARAASASINPPSASLVRPVAPVVVVGVAVVDVVGVNMLVSKNSLVG